MTTYETPTAAPITTIWERVATFRSYQQAQSAVDRLSDDGFPVHTLNIVGTDLRTVERVTGRTSNSRAALTGALSGAWLGLFIGLLLSLIAPTPASLGLIAGSALLGAVLGGIAGFVGHTAIRGRRDFTSSSTLVADQYDVIARDGTAARARLMLQAEEDLITGDLAGHGDVPAQQQ